MSSYSSASHKYELRVPAAWEKKEKAGADVLWEDPSARSTSLGVTVSPVRVASITDFGSLQDVGTKLLDAEKRKESTLGVEMLRQSSHQSGGAGELLYDYEYSLDSTRGKKRIFNTVTIQNSNLYIVNGMCKSEAGGACEAEPLLRDAATSFVVRS